LLLVEEKAKLMARMGKKELEVQLTEPLAAIPAALSKYNLTQTADKTAVIYTYDTKGERTGITQLLNNIASAGLSLRDVSTRQSSLEDIFVTLVQEDAA
jgi:ABC-2 type transport system ATP-binding protein